MANAKYKRKELRDALKLYTVIKDCIEGEQRIKSQGVTYLPIPNEADEKDDGSKRYMAYKLRAVFYNVTKRTLDGLCGQIFTRDPVTEVPDQLKPILADADGAGVDLIQLAKRCTRLVVGYGRAGLFIDYPTVDGATSKAQIEAGDIRPTITLYEPEKIINWRTTKRGARTLLSLVVLEEIVVKSDDGFEAKEVKQYRALRLIDNVYRVEVYPDSAQGSPIETFIPTGSDGKPLTEIPFTFIGCENNDITIDEPPMYDIAALNIAHYRNSADYEESSFMAGQPTPVFAGLTQDWVDNVLKGKVKLGARAAVMLPINATASLLQAESNSMPMEAMSHKEKQMVALGAKVVEQRAVVRTAKEAGIDHTTESSVLASSAKNVASAVTFALVWAANFMGVDSAKIKFTLNTDFDIAKMSSEERRQLIEEWQSGAIAFEEMRSNMRKAGIATLDDKTARTTIDKELASIPGAKDGTDV